MKLVFPAFNYPPKIGGPATSVPELAKRLAGKGFEVHVIAQKFKGYKDKKISGVKIHRVKHFEKGVFSSTSFGYASTIPFMALKTRKLVIKERPLAVHCHDISVSLISSIIGRALSGLKPPIISKYTGDIALEYLLKKKNAGIIRRHNYDDKISFSGFHAKALEKIQSFVVGKSDIIACPSNYQKQRLIKKNVENKKIVVLKNAVDTTVFKPLKEMPEKSSFRVLFFGRLVKWKGIDFLIEAIKILSFKFRDIELEIIGSGPQEKNLKEKVSLLELKNVFFSGKIEHSMLPKKIWLADVIVFPSLYDPYPHSVLEAMACGKPVIATSVGGIPEQIKNNFSGLLVKPFSSSEIVEAIKKLYFSEELRKKLGRNAELTASKHFSWDKVIKEYISFYESLQN